MDFSQALIEIKNGNLIYRKSKGRRNFVVLANNFIVSGFGCDLSVLKNAEGEKMPMPPTFVNVSEAGICVWGATAEDLLAEDWASEDLD